MMTAKLTITVAVDLDSNSVTVRPAGTLISENVRGLLAVVRRAERTLPGFVVGLDLSHVLAASRDALGDLSGSGAVILPSPDRPGGWRCAAIQARYAA